MNMDPEN